MDNINPMTDKRKATREKLLACARELFDELGFEKTNIIAIAQRAGLTKGAIYNNWSNKSELWAEVYGKPYAPPEEELNRLKLLVRRAHSFLRDSVKYAAEGRVPMSNYYAGQALSELEEILNDK